MNIEVIHDSLVGSVDGTIAFPDVVRTMLAEGVESYHADLVRMEKTFYTPDGETCVEKMNLPPRAIAQEFSSPDVIAAIRASQAGKSKYPEFLNRVMDAGTTSYVVFLNGKRAIYFGRKGEFHIEEFPRAN